MSLFSSTPTTQSVAAPIGAITTQTLPSPSIATATMTATRTPTAVVSSAVTGFSLPPTPPLFIPTVIAPSPVVAPAAAAAPSPLKDTLEAAGKIAGSIATIVGTAGQIAATVQQGQVDQAAAEREAEAAKQDEALAKEIAAIQQREALEDATRAAQFEQRGRRLVRGMQVAKFAASGVISGVGSPLLTEIESLRMERESVDDILLSGGRTARDVALVGALRTQAAQSRAANAITASRMATTRTLGGLSSIATEIARRSI